MSYNEVCEHYELMCEKYTESRNEYNTLTALLMIKERETSALYTRVARLENELAELRRFKLMVTSHPGAFLNGMVSGSGNPMLDSVRNSPDKYLQNSPQKHQPAPILRKSDSNSPPPQRPTSPARPTPPRQVNSQVERLVGMTNCDQAVAEFALTNNDGDLKRAVAYVFNNQLDGLYPNNNNNNSSNGKPAGMVVSSSTIVDKQQSSGEVILEALKRKPRVSFYDDFKEERRPPWERHGSSSDSI